MIPFNKPYFTGKEAHYITIAAQSGKISGNGIFTSKCHSFFEKKYSFKKALLTTSCTDALEMAAILLKIKPGDEVVMPSFTFVSTANAFILRGAKIVFADVLNDIPNIKPLEIERLLTEKTKAVVVVHYAGIACQMDEIVEICKTHNLFLVEDAAQGIDSYYKNIPLGSIGDFGAFSFHETKNLISGEGGMLAVNNPDFSDRSEIIWEKGTNRAAFHRGEVNKYGWVDIGSSYLPSEITAAFLFAQLEHIEIIQKRRIEIWKKYFSNLEMLENSGFCLLPKIPDYSTNNGHNFFVVTRNHEEQKKLISYLKQKEIQAVFHYLPLHLSDYFKKYHNGDSLKNTLKFSECIVRLPFYFELSNTEIDKISSEVINFYKNI